MFAIPLAIVSPSVAASSSAPWLNASLFVWDSLNQRAWKPRASISAAASRSTAAGIQPSFPSQTPTRPRRVPRISSMGRCYRGKRETLAVVTERDLVGYGASPPDPQWPGGARLALSFVLNYEEGAERTPL